MPVVEKIIAQRGNVLHLYQMLLHSVPLAEGWLAYLTAIRQHCSLPGALRELAIMRVTMLNGAQYEADQHAPVALQEGVSRQQLDALADWSTFVGFSAEQRTALALTDAMTREVKVPSAVLNAVHAHLDDRQVVELVATIAAYNMVSRFLVALAIDTHDARQEG